MKIEATVYMHWRVVLPLPGLPGILPSISGFFRRWSSGYFSKCIIYEVSTQNETKMAEGSVAQEQEEQSENTEENSTPYCDHPVYREISYTNGRINKMKKDEVKRCLKERGLDSR